MDSTGSDVDTMNEEDKNDYYWKKYGSLANNNSPNGNVLCVGSQSSLPTIQTAIRTIPPEKQHLYNSLNKGLMYLEYRLIPIAKQLKFNLKEFVEEKLNCSSLGIGSNGMFYLNIFTQFEPFFFKKK